MTAFLTTLLRLSVLGSLLAAVLFLLKPLLRGRVSRAAAYYLWLLVLLRLCIPGGLTLTLPAQAAPTLAVPDQATAFVQTAPGGSPATPTPVAAPPSPVTVTPTPAAIPPVAVTERLLMGIWATGFVMVGGWYLHGYRYLARRVWKTAVPAGPEAQAVLHQLDPQGRVRLVESPTVNAPLLLGLLHPTIVLPRGVTDPARLRDILSHELTHARRYDLLVKWFAALAASIHWFNPLLILVRREIGRACELACDEAVVKALDAPARKHYGETLLLLAAEAPMGALPLAVTLCEEKKTLQERLVSIVKVQKPTPAALLLTLVLVLALGGCALVTGTKHAEAPDPFGTLTLPQEDITLHLDMPRKDVEALLGGGEDFYVESMNLSNPTVAYNLPDGLLLVDYEQMTKVEGDRVHGMRCFSSAGYSSDPRVNRQFTPAAQKMFQEAGEFQFQAVQGTSYGHSFAELKALLPDGSRFVQGRGDDPDSLMTMYAAYGEETMTLYYLTEETGVYQIEVMPWSGGDAFDNIECLANITTGFGYSPMEGNMTWDTLETTLGPGKPQGDAVVYGSGDDTLVVTGSGDDCILEALGANWKTTRGIHVGHTLEDLNARYDGSLQRDQLGRFYQVEETRFLLTIRLDETDTVTSLRLEGKEEAL